MDEEIRDEETDHLLPKHPTASRRFFQERTVHSGGESSNAGPHAGQATNTPMNQTDAENNGNASNQTSSQDSEPLSTEDIFTLLGMTAPTSSSGATPKHLESAHGFYSHMLQKQRHVSRQYRLYDAFIIMLMILQLCTSAVFIILGSLPHIDSHIAVAALGAISTVVAGVLALMKGQGLPNRMRMERDGLRRVIFETEELYWDARAGRQVDFDDVVRLREAFINVVEDARKNHPDVWTASPVGTKPVVGVKKARMTGDVAKM